MRCSILLLALIGMALSVSMVESTIRCTDDVCSRIRCRMETEQSCAARDVPGRYRFDPKGGFCGCCPACIKVLQEQEDCHRTLLIGGPKTVECGPGLVCSHKDSQAVCVKQQ